MGDPVTCASPPVGQWGTYCAPDASLDSVGWPAHCVNLYLNDYSSPIVATPCYGERTQKMWIACRPEDDFQWGHDYTPFRTQRSDLGWNPAPNEAKFAKVKRAQAQTSRGYPYSAFPPFCVNPP